jgi:hypothetical protein
VLASLIDANAGAAATVAITNVAADKTAINSRICMVHTIFYHLLFYNFNICGFG